MKAEEIAELKQIEILDPNRAITQSSIKTTRDKLRHIQTYKVSDISAWLDELKLFVNVIQTKKYHYGALVNAGKFDYLPNYCASLNTYFIFMISYFEPAIRKEYKQYIQSLQERIHRVGLTVKDAWTIAFELNDLDCELSLYKEVFGLGLASMSKRQYNEKELKTLILAPEQTEPKQDEQNGV